MKDVTVIDDAFIARGIEASRVSPRKRAMLPLHAAPTDPVQRMLNCVQPGTYIPPHRHLAKTESILVVRGAVRYLTFRDDGTVASALTLEAGSGTIGVDCPANVYHTLVALKDDAVFFELKAGPYDAATDKDVPAWAPAEGSDGADAYLAGLEAEND